MRNGFELLPLAIVLGGCGGFCEEPLPVNWMVVWSLEDGQVGQIEGHSSVEAPRQPEARLELRVQDSDDDAVIYTLVVDGDTIPEQQIRYDAPGGAPLTASVAGVCEQQGEPVHRSYECTVSGTREDDIPVAGTFTLREMQSNCY